VFCIIGHYVTTVSTSRSPLNVDNQGFVLALDADNHSATNSPDIITIIGGLFGDEIIRRINLFSDRLWCVPKMNTYTGQILRLDCFLIK
jgi:hypothetical protein